MFNQKSGVCQGDLSYLALAGGLSLLLGYRARLGAWLLVVFLVPVTLMMHAFWAVSDPALFSIQLTLFVRNLLMLGAALFITHAGAGSLSLDALLVERELDREARTVIP